MTAEKPLAERPEFSPLSLARMLWKHKLLIGLYREEQKSYVQEEIIEKMLDLFQNVSGFGRPQVRLRVLIVVVNVAPDRLLQLGHAVKNVLRLAQMVRGLRIGMLALLLREAAPNGS